MTLILLWPLAGWLSAFFFMWWPAVKDQDALTGFDYFGLLLVIFCGAVVGPFGVLWYFLNK